MLKIIVLFSVSTILAVDCTAQDSFTILNYNALHGFSGDSALQKRYVEWVKGMDPDVVVYQEMNNYTQFDIGSLSESYGQPYAVIMNREYIF